LSDFPFTVYHCFVCLSFTCHCRQQSSVVQDTVMPYQYTETDAWQPCFWDQERRSCLLKPSQNHQSRFLKIKPQNPGFWLLWILRLVQFGFQKTDIRHFHWIPHNPTLQPAVLKHWFCKQYEHCHCVLWTDQSIDTFIKNERKTGGKTLLWHRHES